MNLTAELIKLRDSYEMSPQDINCGLCAEFATQIWQKCCGVEIISDEDMGAIEYTHTFISYGGRFYDAECVTGVENWKDLPIFQEGRR